MCLSVGKIGPLGKTNVWTDIRKILLSFHALIAQAFLEPPFITSTDAESGLPGYLNCSRQLPSGLGEGPPDLRNVGSRLMAVSDNTFSILLPSHHSPRADSVLPDRVAFFFFFVREG